MIKRQLSAFLLMSAILIGVIFCLPVGAKESSFPYGDVDGDGDITIIDVALIQRHLAGIRLLDEDAQRRGLVSGGDELTSVDATLIQRYDVKLIDRFPVEENVVTIRFTDNKKWGTVYAYLFNETTGEAPTEMPGILLTDSTVTDEGYNEYSFTADVSKYDRVIFSNGKRQTIEAPVTKASYGFKITDKNTSKYDVDVYTGGSYQAGEIQTVKMDYPGYEEGVQKTVWIYLPDGYDPTDTSKKYSVLYMDDGQVMLGTLPNDDWRCDKTIRSLMYNGEDGIIIVGISSLDGVRDREMRPYIDIDASTIDPDIAAEYPDKTKEELLEMYKEYCDGNTFADFTVNTVIPYVESHYNVNSVRGFTGSSGGGLEAFYIGMEYPEVFDYVGVMSPSLNIYDASAWNKYLDAKDFSGKVPRMYFFCGNKDLTEKELYPYSVEAESWLLDHQYPSDRIRTTTNSDTSHMHKYWGLYLPELLCWGMDL